jgi:hypothetical protein
VHLFSDFALDTLLIFYGELDISSFDG